MASYRFIGPRDTETAEALSGMDAPRHAFVLDLAATGPDGLRELRGADKPVVILNARASAMASALGIGVDAPGAIWEPGRNGAPGHIHSVPDTFGTFEHEDPLFEERAGKGDKGSEPTGTPETGHDSFAPMMAMTTAQRLNAGLAAMAQPTPGSHPAVDPVPEGAAGKQFTLSIDPVTYHPRCCTWESKNTPVTLTGQTATISVPMFVEIYASPDPANKFLRSTVMGTGFSPGTMLMDSNWGRHVFQDRMRVMMELGRLPPGSVMIVSEPKTLNLKATYTSSSSITIGLKPGEDAPEPSGSATISASVTSTLSDFKVLEKSAGNTAEWHFDMQLCGDKSQGRYDVNNRLSLFDFWGNAWAVPGLASSTLFPACMAAWSLPLDCQSQLPLTITPCHRLTYTRDNYAGIFAHGCTWNRPQPYTVDFGAVSV